MRGYVVDASVGVKWLVADPLSDESATLLDSGATLLVPDLFFAEARQPKVPGSTRRSEKTLRRWGSGAEEA